MINDTPKEVIWGGLRVGDYVKVERDGFFPADIIVLKSSNENGQFFVETKNLDGETNLKTKTVPKDLID